jgi:hypothetical protein
MSASYSAYMDDILAATSLPATRLELPDELVYIVHKG